MSSITIAYLFAGLGFVFTFFGSVFHQKKLFIESTMLYCCAFPPFVLSFALFTTGLLDAYQIH